MIKKIKNLRVSDGNVTGLVYWDVSDDEEFYWDLPWSKLVFTVI